MHSLKRLFYGIGLLGATALVASGLAPDPPDSRLNPTSGSIEIADQVWTGTDYDIRLTINSGIGVSPEVHSVTASGLDDLRPRLAHAPTGDAWIVWWRDGDVDQILVRKRGFADKSWTTERVLSDPAVGSRRPSVVHDGTKLWTAFEVDDGNGDTGVVVGVIVDEPDPLDTAEPVAGGVTHDPVDVRIEAEAGRVWVTWIDSGSEVGFSVYDAASESWGLPGYESYAADEIGAARERIRNALLAN